MSIEFIKNLILQKLTAPIRQFFKFCLVGFLGAVINLVFLWLLVEYFRFYYLLAAAISFILSVINNYFWNKYWTFGENGRVSSRQFFNFLFISIVGLLINLFIMYLLVTKWHTHYLLSQFIAIMIVVLWNFLMNRNITFKK